MPGDQPRLRLPASVRLRGQRAFRHVFEHGQAVREGKLVLHGARNGTDLTRLGISVGRRFGRAVQRNRAKRLIREAFRLVRHRLPAGLDLVAVPQPGACLTLAHLLRTLPAMVFRLDRRLASKG